MKRKVKVTYSFIIEYEHEDHLKYLVRELKKHPIFELGGARSASDGHTYGYNCTRIGTGKIVDA